MRIFQISKGRGRGHRTIYAPSKREKERLRRLLPELEQIALREDVCGVQHGFMPGRSPVTNALVHRGYVYTLSMDLADFFDNVRREHLAGLIPEPILDQILVDGAARQGLPTSPLAANIAASRLDVRIVAALAGRGVYTRYADDLTISSNDLAVVKELRETVPRLAAEFGWQIHPRKTQIQYSGFGRRIITGVSVADDIRAPRRKRRKTRVVAHKLVLAVRSGKRRKLARRLAGHLEWEKLRLPGGGLTRVVMSGEGAGGEGGCEVPVSGRRIIRVQTEGT